MTFGLWLALLGLGWAAERPAFSPPFPEARPLSVGEKRYYKKLLGALEEMVGSSQEGRQVLGHLLEEAKRMSEEAPYAILFSDYYGKDWKAWGACCCFDADVRKDFLLMNPKLVGLDPYLAYAAWVHSLQHRYDKRLQRELYRGTLYTLGYEKRGFVAEVAAFELALKAGKVSPAKLQPGPETEYYQHLMEARQALEKGETSPKFVKLARSYFNKESRFRPKKVEEADQVYSRLSREAGGPKRKTGDGKLRIARFEMERGMKLKVEPEDLARFRKEGTLP